ncbi:hypothetical protein JCM10908_003307 [Rhodotorula pacifica]|uniref:uncharacterized protein n=1 Tax=Rhodotorula pacifica TaxID=1495444 RepID=UPI003171DFAA
MAELVLGQVFSDLKAARLAITEDCATLTKDFKVAKGDTTRLRVTCARDKDCSFLVLGSFKKAQQAYSISTLDAKHTCVGAAERACQATSRLTFLVSQINSKFPVQQKTSAAQIQD